MQATLTSAGPSRLRFTVVNPFHYEADLKGLMTANGHTAFEDFFDRGYGAVVADGGANWVGFDHADRIRISLTQFVHDFQFRGAPLRVGVIGNVMAAQQYRTFFPAFTLFRRMLSDTRDRGELDFVYGDPTPRAVAISKAVKMDHVGDLDRLVLPVADARLTRHLGARLFSRVPSMLGSRVVADVRCNAAATRDVEEFSRPLGPDDRMIARHSVSMLQRRLSEFPGSNDFVVELRCDRGAADWDALVLLRLARETKVLSMLSVRRRSDVSLRAVIPSLAPIARRVGAFRLQVETLTKSQFAKDFRSLGFRARGDTLPIFVKGFSPAGAEAIRNVTLWELTALDMER